MRRPPIEFRQHIGVRPGLVGRHQLVDIAAKGIAAIGIVVQNLDLTGFAVANGNRLRQLFRRDQAAVGIQLQLLVLIDADHMMPATVRQRHGVVHDGRVVRFDTRAPGVAAEDQLVVHVHPQPQVLVIRPAAEHEDLALAAPGDKLFLHIVRTDPEADRERMVLRILDRPPHLDVAIGGAGKPRIQLIGRMHGLTRHSVRHQRVNFGHRHPVRSLAHRIVGKVVGTLEVIASENVAAVAADLPRETYGARLDPDAARKRRLARKGQCARALLDKRAGTRQLIRV